MTVAELEPDVLPERAEARQALSDAIAAVDDARARLAEAKAAAEAGMSRAIDIGNRIERLRAELPQLPIAPPAGAVLAALSAGGDVLEVERSPRAAAQAEIEALEASLASVRRARDVAEREVESRKRAVEDARLRAHRAAVGVLKASGAAERLLDGLLALERQIIERRLGLAFLLRNDGVPLAEKAAVERVLDGYALPSRSAAIDHWGRTPAMKAWEAALKALERDADAPLPG
jgi:hypothetical protein